MSKISVIAAAAAIAAPFACCAASAQVFLSANDGKQVRAGDPVPGPFDDELVTLTLDAKGRPHVVGRVLAPATLNGPPVSIAMARSGRFALVASAQRFGSDKKLQPYGIVSMIDLTAPAKPRVFGQVEVPPGAMGVTMVRDGRRALVASASDDSVSLLTIASDGTMKLVDTVKLAPKAEPRDVVIAPDDRSAYVLQFGAAKISRLAIEGNTLRIVGDIPVGTNPDGAIITRDGRYLYNGNFGGTPLTGTIGAISTVDLRSGKMVAAIAVGQTPEHVALSPDGRFLVSVVGNGSSFTRVDPSFPTVFGRLKVFRAGGSELKQVAEAVIGHNCQGAAFSDDGRTILVQCAVEKTVSAFRFDGNSLTPVADGTLKFDTRPGAIATVNSR